VREIVCVCVCVRERDRVCVKEIECVCERDRVCVRERARVREREIERECVGTCEVGTSSMAKEQRSYSATARVDTWCRGLGSGFRILGVMM
jgi:hypothetical protein